MSMKYMYITNDIKVAEMIDSIGVDRIFIDLEQIGKQERQNAMNTVKSQHTYGDIKNIKKIIKNSQLLVRCNPIHDEYIDGYDTSKDEIDKIISNGADIIMLPMWKTLDDVRTFIKYVDKRAKTLLLLETGEAELILDEVLKINGIDEIHIGLNDLHISYKKKFMFELLSNGVVESICEKIAPTNIFYGFGGIARIGQGLLPAEYILGEHYRLNSKMVILSRSFYNSNDIVSFEETYDIFNAEFQKLKDYEKKISLWNEEDFIMNKDRLKKSVEKIVENI